MSKKDTQLICMLDRFEDSKAVLRFDFSHDDRQELVIAKRFLPKNLKEGDFIYLEAFTSEAAHKRQNDLARKMLEEILKGE
jgi:uncharacterized protein YqeY